MHVSDGVFDSTTKTLRAAVTTPAFGVDDTQYDFGFAPLALGDRVFYDVNGNGLQDCARSLFVVTISD